MKSIIIIISILLSLTACKGKSEKSSSKGSTTEQSQDLKEAVTEDLSTHPGFKVYNQQCLPCHQADGSGVPNMYPTLHNTDWINGDNATLINIVLNGLDTEIEVNGEYFKTSMAPLKHLNDQEVSDVLNYVRKKYGSDKTEITVEEVQSVRSDS
jgi:mono/diheme cytochrome c family protein